MNWLDIIGLAVRYGGVVKAILDEANSNDSIIKKLSTLASPVGNLLSQLGSELFPKAAPAIQQIGAAVAAFDPNVVKWIQGALNQVMNAGLAVDGKYGPKTTAAVETFQKAHGLVIDGVAGSVTQGLLNSLLSALSK